MKKKQIAAQVATGSTRSSPRNSKIGIAFVAAGVADNYTKKVSQQSKRKKYNRGGMF